MSLEAVCVVLVHQTDTLYLNGVEFMPGNLIVIGNREKEIKENCRTPHFIFTAAHERAHE